MKTLHARLLAAHAAKDAGALFKLYTQAAEGADTDDARAFFLTHAYIYALEKGDAEAVALRQVLIDMGRETPI